MVELKNIQTARKDIFKDGFYLMLFKPERIPPHLGFIVNNELYDVSVKGKNAGAKVNFDKLFAANHSFMAIKLNITENKEFLYAFFTKYQTVDENTSCLMPIKEYFKVLWNNDLPNVNYVFHLIPELQKKGLIDQIFIHNVKLTERNSFVLREYSHKEIFAQIKKLKERIRVTI